MYFYTVRFDLPQYLSARLAEPLPGEKAQRMMSPGERIAYPVQGRKPRLSAVLSLFIPDITDIWSLVLIKRPIYEGFHSGQIAFPGGKHEEGDISLIHTALRETAEEIGLNVSVEVLGALTDIYIPPSNYLVTPFVAIAKERQPWYPNSSEVDQVIEMPINQLLDEQIVSQGSFITGFKKEVMAPYFALNDYKIWGATAMMLSELKWILKEGISK